MQNKIDGTVVPRHDGLMLGSAAVPLFLFLQLSIILVSITTVYQSTKLYRATYKSPPYVYQAIGWSCPRRCYSAHEVIKLNRLYLSTFPRRGPSRSPESRYV